MIIAEQVEFIELLAAEDRQAEIIIYLPWWHMNLQIKKLSNFN